MNKQIRILYEDDSSRVNSYNINPVTPDGFPAKVFTAEECFEIHRGLSVMMKRLAPDTPLAVGYEELD